MAESPNAVECLSPSNYATLWAKIGIRFARILMLERSYLNNKLLILSIIRPNDQSE